jgi:RNA polymerase primary sigma factor
MIAQLISHIGSPVECESARLVPATRARRMVDTSLKYVDHPSFDDPTARDAMLAPLAESTDDQVSRGLQPSEWPTPLPADRFGRPFLSREQEAHLFRKMNYLKCRASQLTDQLDPDRANPRDLDEIELLQCEALALKNRLVETYLRLVVFIARKRAKVGYDLCECVSDGNLALIRAVDCFDFAKGNRFTTYATRVIQNVLVRNGSRFMRRRGHQFAVDAESVAARDCDALEYEREEVWNQRRTVLNRWLGRLDQRERGILVSRYGLGGAPEQTLAQLGRELGISKERVRQIQVRAQAKLRALASRQAASDDTGPAGVERSGRRS